MLIIHIDIFSMYGRDSSSSTKANEGSRRMKNNPEVKSESKAGESSVPLTSTTRLKMVQINVNYL